MSDEAAAVVQEQTAEREFKRIVVEVEDDNGRTQKTAFDGAWLVDEE